MSFESVTSVTFAFGLPTLALTGMVFVTLLTLWRLRLRFALRRIGLRFVDVGYGRLHGGFLSWQ